MATFGSIEALGSGYVVFCYPYADCHVTFILCGCLFAPMAPINLLSVGMLIEHHGMSCLFSPAGIMKVFFPSDHLKLPGLVFQPNVTNCLSFLTLAFILPASIPNPSVIPAPSCLISSLTIPMESPTPSCLTHTTPQVCTTAGQAHDDLICLPDFCMVEHLDGAVTVVDVVAGIDAVGVLNGGAEDQNADGCWDDVHEQSHPLSSNTTTDPTTSTFYPNLTPGQWNLNPAISSIVSMFLPYVGLTFEQDHLLAPYQVSSHPSASGAMATAYVHGHIDVISDASASADVVLHGFVNVLGMDACFLLDYDAIIMSHGGADAQPDMVALMDDRWYSQVYQC